MQCRLLRLALKAAISWGSMAWLDVKSGVLLYFCLHSSKPEVPCSDSFPAPNTRVVDMAAVPSFYVVLWLQLGSSSCFPSVYHSRKHVVSDPWAGGEDGKPSWTLYVACHLVCNVSWIGQNVRPIGQV